LQRGSRQKNAGDDHEHTDEEREMLEKRSHA
jgi:hypothetical protein